MLKTLILVRHGHRDTSARELDNGLDEKGREQAKAIKRFFLSRFKDPSAVWLVSSPKLRCVETLLPLAKSLNRPVNPHPLLDEAGDRESGESLHARVRAFIEEWRRSQVAVTVASSHGDWLPLAIQDVLGLTMEPKKGSWLELESAGTVVSLKWAVPTFKHFWGDS